MDPSDAAPPAGDDALDSLVAAVRADPAGSLVALDFDGTLAPIVERPEDARPVAGALAAVRALVATGAHVAVVTGREAAHVVERAGFGAVTGLQVEGLYGADPWPPDPGRPAPDAGAVERLRSRLPEIVAEVDPRSLRVEDKGLSLVVHARGAADADALLARLRERTADLAGDLGLELHDGRAVLEFRLPGYDKGAAVQRLLRVTGATTALYAGDDVADLEGFAALRAAAGDGVRSWCLAVGSAEAPRVAAAADVVLGSSDELVDLLRRLAG